MIDTHCHISSCDYNDIDEIIMENRLNEVEKIIVSSCSKDTNKESIELALKYEDLYLTLGYHPEYANVIDDDDLDDLLKLVINNKKIVGIGEIGLDYHYGKENIEKQKMLFEKQLKIAEKVNLPVIIHSRDAVNDTIQILKNHKVSGVIHCFSGSLETAQIYIKMGFKLGIGGVVTFKNSKLWQVIEGISLKDIVLETDSPYLTPEPFRGRKNSSKYLKYIALKIADINDISVDEVKNVTTRTANEIFNFK